MSHFQKNEVKLKEVSFFVGLWTMSLMPSNRCWHLCILKLEIEHWMGWGMFRVGMVRLPLKGQIVSLRVCKLEMGALWGSS